MPIITDYPLNDKWSEQSSNRIDFNTTEFQQGINYKGSVVSNQLNGISFILSQLLQFNQNTGGYYNPSVKYRKGNFVSIIHKGQDHQRQLETYICINDDMGNLDGSLGIVAKPPVLNAITSDESGLTIYTGGNVNNAYWKRVDVGGSAKINEQKLTLPTAKKSGNPFLYITELVRLPDLTYDSTDEFIKEIKSKLYVTTKLGTKSYTVELNLFGKYIRDDDKKAYIKPCDHWNMPVPDVSFGECIWRDTANDATSNSYQPTYGLDYCNVLSANQNPSITQLLRGEVTPYGFNVIIGYTTGAGGVRSWGVYLGFMEGNSVTLSGESSVDVSINSEVQYSNITVMNIIPVRPHGGANGYSKLGELREYDDHANTMRKVMLHYSKGEIELQGAASYGDKAYGAYWLMSRFQETTSPSTKEHTARHTRCYGGTYAGSSAGQYLEPGLPNISYLGSTGSIGRYAVYVGCSWGKVTNGGWYIAQRGGQGYTGYTSGSTFGVTGNFMDFKLFSSIYKSFGFTPTFYSNSNYNKSIEASIGGYLPPEESETYFSRTQHEDVTVKSVCISRYIRMY